MNKKIIGAFIAFAFLVGCGGQDNLDEQEGTQPNNATVIYDCEGEMINANFNNETEPSTAQLHFVEKNVNIPLNNVESGSGARYSDGDITFWTHQGEATLSIEGTDKSINCVEKTTSEDNTVDENGNIVAEGCQTWFDGCNTCKVNEEGMPMACTRMACDKNVMQPARCMDEESINNDKQTCTESGGVWSEEQNSCFEDPATMADEGEK